MVARHGGGRPRLGDPPKPGRRQPPEEKRPAERAQEPPRGVDLPPPVWRDPWALASALAVVPLVLHSLGAPLGEPFADDFDYLRHELLEGGGSFFDGGGSTLWWRPLARQVYFGLLSPLIVARPGLVYAFHLLLLAIASVLLYRAFRRRWPGSWSAACGTFFLLAESTRMLPAWPSHMCDLGALLFAALALHEAACRRLATAMIALLGSLLCKEVGVLAALAVPLFPAWEARDRRERLTWLVATAALVGGWGIAYLAVQRHAHLILPHQAITDPEVLAVPLSLRVVWALANSVRAAFSMAAVRERWETGIEAGMAVVLGAAIWRIVTDRASRSRLRGALPWISWGLAWFVLGTAPLAEVFPAWAPYRSAFGSIGLAAALVSLLAPAGSWLLAAMVGLRLVSFSLSPGPPRLVTAAPMESGAAFDFPKLARLEKFVRETRTLLQRHYPSLPKGALVGHHHLPLMTGYAFSGDKALQVWYRDTTIRWVSFEEFSARPDLPLLTLVEYQAHREPQLALVDAGAMRALLRAMEYSKQSEWDAALAELQRADSLQQDPDAAVLLATIAAKRAILLSTIGDSLGAEREALRGYALWPDNPDSRYVIAKRRFAQGRLAEAQALLDTVVALGPGDKGAATLLGRVREARARLGR